MQFSTLKDGTNSTNDKTARVRNITLPLCVLVKSFRLPTATAVVDTVRWLTVNALKQALLDFHHYV